MNISGHNASARTVIVLEFAHLWARVQNMTEAQARGSHEAERFALFESKHPAEAALAKAIQYDAFDRVNHL